MISIIAAVLPGLLFVVVRCYCKFCQEHKCKRADQIPSARKWDRGSRSNNDDAAVLQFPPRAYSSQRQTPRRRKSCDAKIAVLPFAACFLALSPGAAAQSTSDGQKAEVEQLRALVLQLQARVEQLEKARSMDPQAARIQAKASEIQQRGTEDATVRSIPSVDNKGISDFLHGPTINFALDGYYGYNFNQPIGRINLLRAYDVSSNSFSINQANLVLEQAPDPASGRRFGARLDFQYGQATEAQQGNPANELRPQVYRPLFQAYGTYIAPVGSGLMIDFGKFASALGIEGNYNKDQINYSRSFLFDFLPFYHMGFRTTYNVSPKLALSYWLVNGIQQTEDFNGFKSQALLFTIKPSSKVSWNMNYYFGQEQPDVRAMLNPGLPIEATQPGLPIAKINPAPDGREHIIDTYLTWAPTPKLTVAAEGDYVVNRVFSQSEPAHADGGAAYLRYQVTPKFALATRDEYLSDRGSLFSGLSQALKENTFTAEYKFVEGFLARAEYRRDYSNRPFFLTDTSGKLSDTQNTATLGLIWWMGRKQGAW